MTDNGQNPAIRVYFKRLKRYEGDNESYKAHCPFCDKGLLILHRKIITHQLMDQCRCANCGQVLIIADIDEIKRNDWANLVK